MQKQKRYQYAVVGVLGFALLFMSIGFVAYAQMLNSSGASALAQKNIIHAVGFDADSYQESDTSVAANTKAITRDDLVFSVTLAQPGDSYGAMVNIVNNGNVNEVLSEIRMSELPEQYADAIEYKIDYADEEYLGTSYNVNSTISTGEVGRQQLFITVNYKKRAQNLGPITLDLSAGLIFN